MYLFLVSISASLVTGPLDQQRLVFSCIVFWWPWHQTKQTNRNRKVLSKTRHPEKKRGKCSKYGYLFKNHHHFWPFPFYLNKKRAPRRGAIFPVFFVVFGLVCAHQLSYISLPVQTHKFETSTNLFSFRARLFWKCVLWLRRRVSWICMVSPRCPPCIFMHLHGFP